MLGYGEIGTPDLGSQESLSLVGDIFQRRPCVIIFVLHQGQSCLASRCCLPGWSIDRPLHHCKPALHLAINASQGSSPGRQSDKVKTRVSLSVTSFSGAFTAKMRALNKIGVNSSSQCSRDLDAPVSVLQVQLPINSTKAPSFLQ